MNDFESESARSYRIKLSIGNETLESRVDIPTGPLKMDELVPLFQSFCETIVGSYQRQYKEEKGLVASCKSGCSACCSQMVPISRPEAYFLVNFIQKLPDLLKETILSRFDAAINQFATIGLLDRINTINQIDDPETKAGLTVDYFAASIACPFLIESRCSIYRHRPLICREFSVTSDPLYCREPNPENVKRLTIPIKVSTILFSLSEDKGREHFEWLPLINLFSWYATQTQSRGVTVSGTDMFENFMQRLSEKIHPRP